MKKFLKIPLATEVNIVGPNSKMYPVLTKSGYKKLLLQTGIRVCSHVQRYNNDKSNDIKLPPEPTTCCMSGCANCVWIEYAESIAKLLNGNNDKIRELVLSKIQDPNLKMFLSIELKNIQYKTELERKSSSKNSTTPNNKELN